MKTTGKSGKDTKKGLILGPSKGLDVSQKRRLYHGVHEYQWKKTWVGRGVDQRGPGGNGNMRKLCAGYGTQ